MDEDGWDLESLIDKAKEAAAGGPIPPRTSSRLEIALSLALALKGGVAAMVDNPMFIEQACACLSDDTRYKPSLLPKAA